MIVDRNDRNLRVSQRQHWGTMEDSGLQGDHIEIDVLRLLLKGISI
jgi:hypothetical protein